ncbi:hypothetical protein ACFOEY_12890 [Paracandidimonas soli]
MPKAPPYCGGDAPALGPEFFTMDRSAGLAAHGEAERCSFYSGPGA